MNKSQSIFAALISLTASVGHAAPPSSLNPPSLSEAETNWCDGVEGRIKHLNAIRSAMLEGLNSLKIGSQATYSVLEERQGEPSVSTQEVWTVQNIDVNAETFTALVEKTTQDGSKSTNTVTQKLKIPDHLIFDRKDSDSCSHPYVVANQYSVDLVVIGSKKIKAFATTQLNLGGADFSQKVSASVPLGIVEWHLSVGQNGKALVSATTKNLMRFKW